jgi:hypothetical protein
MALAWLPFRLFVSSPVSKRERERLEAEVMDALYAAAAPFCDIPDRRTYQARRQPHEPRSPLSMSALTSYMRCRHR